MIDRLKRIGLLCCFSCLALTGPALFSQSLTTGDVSGTVTDPSAAAIPNATVNLTNKDTSATQTTKTNTQGQYHFAFLPPAQYQVEVKASVVSNK